MFLRRTIKSSDDIQLRILTTFKCLLIDIKKYIQHNQLQHFLQHDFFFYGKRFRRFRFYMPCCKLMYLASSQQGDFQQDSSRCADPDSIDLRGLLGLV